MKTAKLTTLTIFTLALGAGAVAFGGCTVTSGTVNDTDGGTSSSSGSSGSSGSSDGGSDSSSDSSTNACPGNNQKSEKIVSDQCQSCLEQNCCEQLKGCFNIVVTAGDGGVKPFDCDQYSDCISKCANDSDPAACYDECDTVSTPEVVAAYDKIFGLTAGAQGCAVTNPTCKTACGIP